MEVVNGKLYNWASNLEDGTRRQAEMTARLPIIAGHVALMPDAHVGMGSTVGSVIPTREAIIPAAIGVDIGCGMIAVRTDLTASDLPDDLGPLMKLVENRIPAGVGKGHDRGGSLNRALEAIGLPPGEQVLDAKNATTLRKKIISQYGSMGGGNHFAEVSLDLNDGVWLVLHSGSRGTGNQLARGHIKLATQIAKRNGIKLEHNDLAYLTEGTPEFDAYIGDMLWSQAYAAGSREKMMDQFVKSLFEVVGKGTESQRINCHHNFTQLEEHNGETVWLTRKGAIQADAGRWGVIPGSMGTKSYIVRGLGNSASYNSCSHGAGRVMSRTRARAELTVESLVEAMGDRTWNANHAEALLDEHPDSYKDIDQVMADQRDLVEPIYELRQIFNFKGQD